MHIRRLEIPGPVVLIPERFEDSRGFLSETHSDERFCKNVAQTDFVLDNHSFSRQACTVRGIQFQISPRAQGKLVRVVRGAIWDVAVDLRTGSPNYGRHVGVELSAENWHQLWVPVGFGHGFCTLVPNTDVIYKVTAPYDSSCERAIIWNDPELGIPWPHLTGGAILSERDQKNPHLKDIPGYFHFEQ